MLRKYLLQCQHGNAFGPCNGVVWDKDVIHCMYKYGVYDPAKGGAWKPLYQKGGVDGPLYTDSRKRPCDLSTYPPELIRCWRLYKTYTVDATFGMMVNYIFIFFQISHFILQNRKITLLHINNKYITSCITLVFLYYRLLTCCPEGLRPSLTISTALTFPSSSSSTLLMNRR